MASKGKSFSVNTGKLDTVLSNIKKTRERIDKLTLLKMNKAVDIVWRIAHAKRPMITTKQAKLEGRTTRVSDVGAEAGVPVRTGALQASVKKEVLITSKGIVGRIWAGGGEVGYASMIEFGTSKMKARPFMRPAINLSRDALKQMFGIKEII